MLFLTVNWVSVSLTLIEESLETSNVYSLLAISNLEINYLKVTSVALSVYIGKNVLQSIRKKHIKCDIASGRELTVYFLGLLCIGHLLRMKEKKELA